MTKLTYTLTCVQMTNKRYTTTTAAAATKVKTTKTTKLKIDKIMAKQQRKKKSFTK